MLLESALPPATVPLSTGKGGDGAYASPARSSSRGPVEHPWDESALEAPLAQEVPASGAAGEVHEPLISQALVTA